METIYALVLVVALQGGGIQVEQLSANPLELMKCMAATEAITIELDETKPKSVAGFTVYCVPIHVPVGPTV